MTTWQRWAVAGLALLVAGAACFSVGFAAGRGTAPTPETAGGNDSGHRLVERVYERIRSSAVDPPSSKALARGAIRGMVNVLKGSNDPHAFLYSPKGYRSFQELTSGRFSGIGVWLRSEGRDLVIASVLPSSPAAKAGIEPGDVITAIEGRSARRMRSEQAVTRIKGPAGSQVRLQIERGDRRLRMAVTRRELELPVVVSHLTNRGRFGYLRLMEFSKGSGEQVREAVSRLEEGGAQGIVLDLRDDGGGLFREALDVAGAFIERGIVVRYRDRSSSQTVYRARGDALQTLPLVVLVNGGTASASEIVAGALQDRDRAIIVGTRTYGKGSVQQVLPLPNASALKFTTATYLTPDGRDINGKGIRPDIEVAASPEEQRRRAVEVLNGIAVSQSGSRG
ncbi:proteolytic complex protein CptA [soil metagenome]